jgi:CheY-like chemotaxis protein
MKKNQKVFIIEDDKIASSIIKNIMKLNKSISIIEVFSNGLFALEKLEELNKLNEKLPDFIVLDFDMPLMNGLEFLENIKFLKGINKIPIFINSSTDEVIEILTCLNYENVKGSFSKPFSTQTLNTILEHVESKMPIN